MTDKEIEQLAATMYPIEYFEKAMPPEDIEQYAKRKAFINGYKAALQSVEVKSAEQEIKIPQWIIDHNKSQL